MEKLRSNVFENFNNGKQKVIKHLFQGIDFRHPYDILLMASGTFCKEPKMRIHKVKEKK